MPENIPAGEKLPSRSPTDKQIRKESWRYRYYDGSWWYFQGPDHWLRWTGRSWQEVKRPRPAETAATDAPSSGPVRRYVAQWRNATPNHEHHGWVGGFYSSGGGYGASDFGYGYGVPNYGPGEPAFRVRN